MGFDGTKIAIDVGSGKTRRDAATPWRSVRHLTSLRSKRTR